MSQNAHTLLLFFNNKQIHNTCLLMFHKLNKEEHEDALAYARKLNVDIEETWNTDWFNQSVHAKEDHIRVYYESGTRYGLPLNLLKQLFDCGLQGAALETFHDQVGEFTQDFFLNGYQVPDLDLYSKLPHANEVVKAHFGSAPDEVLQDEITRPVSITDLIKQEDKNKKDAADAVNALRDIVGLANETDTNPMDVIKGALLLRAGAKGLIHACMFCLVTVLLFKGLWLWITLSILLAIILVFLNMHRVLQEFDPQEDNLEENEIAAEVNNAN